MTRSFRAPEFARSLAVALCVATAGVSRAWAEPPVETSTRLLKSFDFDERPRGNFEDTPMHWRRLTGDGLPAFSGGMFDEWIGRSAPPSFRFTLRGGSIGYEYAEPDLSIEPRCDYRVEGWVRAVGLERATAFLAITLLDAAGQPVPGSERVSNSVRSVGGDEPWQPLIITVPGSFTEARRMCLQLWVLQDYAVQPPGDRPDPIYRQEVSAQVWFDDLAITRLPRLRITCSNAGSLVRPGRAETLRVDAQNPTPAQLEVRVRVIDPAGGAVLESSETLSAGEAAEIVLDIPPLPSALYTVLADLSDGEESLIRRTLRFAVLPDAHPPGRHDTFGVDLGLWPQGDPDGAAELIAELGCGTAKVGLRLPGAPQRTVDNDYLWQLRNLTRRLAVQRIETMGVLLGTTPGQTTRAALLGEEGAEERIGPILAYVGGSVRTWQLGEEEVELRDPGGWDQNGLELVRRKLQRFVAAPQLVIPRSVLDAREISGFLNASQSGPPEGGGACESPPVDEATSVDELFAYSYWLPPSLPASALAWQLAFWPESAATSEPRTQRWIRLGFAPAWGTPLEARIIDLTRRVIIAKAVAPDRIYLSAPFELTYQSGAAAWQPTEEFLPLRALLLWLAEARAIGSLALAHDSVALVFRQQSSSALVLWTWQEHPQASVELYLGPNARARTILGEPCPLEYDGPQARVPLSELPLIIEHVNVPLLQLQESFRVEPASIQLHDPEPRPVLMLRNSNASEMAGLIELRLPRGWSLTPNPIRFSLGPDEELAQPLHFSLPPRQIAGPYELDVEVQLTRPDSARLSLKTCLRVELREIAVHATARWEGDDLIVEQTLQNNTAAPLRFNAFCQAPGRMQLEGLFLNVAPGERAVEVYRLPAAGDLRGRELWLGVQEIGGPRRLDQLVAVPP